MNFLNFYGNEGAKKQLSAFTESDRFPHALLLCGAAGCGKRTLARRIAQSLLCDSPDSFLRPCGVCSACKKVAQGIHPDLMIVSGGNSSRSFHIDAIRKVREDVNVIPNEGRKKIYILENASSMTESAQNALLKVMEEPPLYACFILTCESATQLLPTILSRAVQISLGEVEKTEAILGASRLCPQATEQQLETAYNICGGNIGKMAEALQEDGLLKRAFDLAEKMIYALLEIGEYSLLQCTMPLLKDKELSRAVFLQLIWLFRDALLRRSGYRAKKEYSPAVEEIFRRLTQQQIEQMLQVLKQSADGLERYANQTLLITKLCAALQEIG